ncbi:MAG: hypothetical protein H6983_06520 [Ectothiorhodospiraceae bacterium]|nr:hypothetical protein [Chromatiales bacterium]MCP5153800.1 hypothetical protein [Ectothiorhodospiraceae bacterium]
MFRRLRRPAIAISAALSLGALPIEAATIIELGDTYHVIEYEAGFDVAAGEGAIAGAVALRIEQVFASGRTKLDNSIEYVFTQPGWSYRIRKSGGLNSAVEVDFDNGDCSARFRAIYKPGTTVVDGGELICR